MNAVNQIAAYLEIDASKIKRCEEWAKVWFVVIQGKGARFVSKKVVQAEVSKKDDFEEVFAHRIDSGKEQGRWLIYGCTHSAKTMSKFIARAKSAGFKSAFFKPGKVGVLLSDVA